MTGIVGLIKVDKPYRNTDIYRVVYDVMDLCGMLGYFKTLDAGSKVLIKPNVVADLPSELGATTDPRVVLGICYVLRDIGLTPLVAESSSIGVDTAYALSLEYGIVSDAGFTVMALDGSETMKVAQVDSDSEMELFRVVADAAAVVSVPKLKTHDQTVVSLGMKNLKGLLPDNIKARVHHRGLVKGIVDLYSVISQKLKIPVLSVVDGLVGMEGLGPAYGTPVDLGVILGGMNLVEVDSVCCGIMGIEPDDIGYLAEAVRLGIGGIAADNIKVMGNVPSDAVKRKFKTASESLDELSLQGLAFDWDQACTGCKNTILSVISELRYRGEKVPELTFCAGRSGKGTDGNGNIYIGNCAGIHATTGKAWVKGCPPVNEELTAEIERIRTK